MIPSPVLSKASNKLNANRAVRAYLFKEDSDLAFHQIHFMGLRKKHLGCVLSRTLGWFGVDVNGISTMMLSKRNTNCFSF